jgi:hypothetical protein
VELHGGRGARRECRQGLRIDVHRDVAIRHVTPNAAGARG